MADSLYLRWMRRLQLFLAARPTRLPPAVNLGRPAHTLLHP